MVVDQGQTLGRSEISRKQVQGWPTLVSPVYINSIHTETPTPTKYHTLHITEGELVNLAKKQTIIASHRDVSILLPYIKPKCLAMLTIHIQLDFMVSD